MFNSFFWIQHGTVKVDAARKRGGIKIVWLSWFTDTIALWHRQDETPYLLDDPSITTLQPSSSGSAIDSHQTSSDPEPDTDDWDEETTKIEKAAAGPQFDLGEIDWNDVNDEVDAAMNESDDDDDDDSKSEKSGMRSGNASEEEGSATDGSHSGIRYALSDISHSSLLTVYCQHPQLHTEKAETVTQPDPVRDWGKREQ
jgi:RNA polymerase II subunit A-like phosphatase